MNTINVYRKKPKLFIYNAKGLPLGTVHIWADGSQHKKTEEGWVEVTKGKVGKEEMQTKDERSKQVDKKDITIGDLKIGKNTLEKLKPSANTIDNLDFYPGKSSINRLEEFYENILSDIQSEYNNSSKFQNDIDFSLKEIFKQPLNKVYVYKIEFTIHI